MKFPSLSFLVLATALAVSGCDSAEERADAFYQKGQELVEAGELDKAILEFRNALQLNQDAIGPRLAYGKALLEQGILQDAVGNLMKVVELDAEHVEARVLLARIFLQARQPQQAMTQIDAVIKTAPDDPDLREVRATTLYAMGRRKEAVKVAQALVKERPASLGAAMVLISERVEAQEYDVALDQTDVALTRNPEDLGLHLTRLSILEKQQDRPGIGVQLREMIRLFPENIGVSKALVRWHIEAGDHDAAEAQLRDTAARLPMNRDAVMDVYRFLKEYRSQTAARDELMRLSRESPDRAFYLRVLAGVDFQAGDVDGSIARVKELLDTDLPPIEVLETKMTLADLERRTGNTDEAARLFDEVLKEDPNNVDGLRLRALNALDEDRPEDAISDLRTALNQEPQNPTLMTILATAHERNGAPRLAVERLALAMQFADYAVPEVLRYANFLGKEGQEDTAEAVLTDALRRRPDAPELMTALARLRLNRQDWRGAEQMAQRLDRLGIPEARQTASGIRIAAASGREDFDASIGLLRDMWAESGESTTAMENLVRTYVQAGDSNKAVSFLSDILKEDPKNLRAQLLLGAVRASQGEMVMAEKIYRQVIADHPERENGYSALATLLQRSGRQDEADQIMREGLQKAPGSARLLLAQAARLELDRRFEDAIGLYEQLYEQNPDAEVIVNNLAALLSEHRADAESQERAYRLARRLHGSPVPAFQDTLGWILYHRGELEEARNAVIIAVEGLPGNPIVNFHLGMIYKDLGQTTLAGQYLQKAIDLGAANDFPQMEQARAALDQLTAQ